MIWETDGTFNGTQVLDGQSTFYDVEAFVLLTTSSGQDILIFNAESMDAGRELYFDRNVKTITTYSF